MKFTCLQENLVKGLNTVIKAIPIKSSMPVLSNVLVATEDGLLKLAATNMATTIVTYVGASIDKEGAITVPARMFHEFVSHLPPAAITGELKDGVLHISVERTNSKFNGVDASEYPDLPVMDEKKVVLELNPQAFSVAVLSVAFAAAIDESRPVLGGLLLKYSKGVLTVVSADGFRLSEKVLKIGGKAEDFSVVVPAKTLIEVARIFGSVEDPIKFVLDAESNLALFSSGDVLVATRILEGEYPDYKKIIPSGSILTAGFSSSNLLAAVRLTSVFAKAGDVSNVIKISFDPSGLVKIRSSSKEVGENNSEFEAEVKGEPLEVAFNAKYLLDFLNNVKFENLLFESNGAIAPGVLKSAEDENYLHIIMPVRIQD